MNGGTAAAFLELCRTLRHNTDVDVANSITALRHDESHINRYILDRDDFTLLSPSYFYPEGWQLPFEVKIISINKEKYFDIFFMKQTTW